ncbi:hypothetical protein [Xanthomonas bromi]|uniref:hypothetical protein n=1 Tax=Xanthomonas bromi TaxID=56449 RepID=UPI00111278CC|nr:hypothetical protein [Xanthomonas bromi]
MHRCKVHRCTGFFANDRRWRCLSVPMRFGCIADAWHTPWLDFRLAIPVLGSVLCAAIAVIDERLSALT